MEKVIVVSVRSESGDHWQFAVDASASLDVARNIVASHMKHISPDDFGDFELPVTSSQIGEYLYIDELSATEVLTLDGLSNCDWCRKSK